MRLHVVLSSVIAAAVAPAASAQPGTRNAIVYGARLAGSSDPWTFGSFVTQSTSSSPIDIQIGVFAFRDRGFAFSTAVWSAYIDCSSTDSVQIPGSGQGNGVIYPFTYGGVRTAVFTNRNAAIGGSGYRISNSTNHTDAVNAGGISVKQPPPSDVGPDNVVTIDGPLVYTFNVTAQCLSLNAPRDIIVRTPARGGVEPSRIAGYSVYMEPTSSFPISVVSSTTSDPVTLNVSWVPAPSAAAALVLAGAAGLRRRRSPCSC